MKRKVIKPVHIPVTHFVHDFFFLSHKISLIDLAEKQASDPVMRKMWSMKGSYLRQKRSEWLERKSHELRKVKGD